MSRRTIREVLKTHTDKLMLVPGVIGVAEGESQGKPCIVVFVLNRNTESLRLFPGNIEGYPVRIEESSEFRAFGK